PPIRSALRDALIRGPIRDAEVAARVHLRHTPEAAEPALGRGLLGWLFGRRAAPTPMPAPLPVPARTAPRSRALRRGRFLFVPLPGTCIEGECVAALLGAELLSGDAAQKSSLWSRPSPRVLHLATHGFILGDEGDEVGPEHSFAPPEAWLV